MATSRTVTIPESVTEEAISSFHVDVGERVMAMIGTGTSTATGFVFNDQQLSTVEISGDNHTALMTGFPAWSPNKPAGTFRVDDLWLVIDAVRAGENLLPIEDQTPAPVV